MTHTAHAQIHKLKHTLHRQAYVSYTYICPTHAPTHICTHVSFYAAYVKKRSV